MKYFVYSILTALISCHPQEKVDSKEYENGYDVTSTVASSSKISAPSGWIEGDSINLDYLDLQKPVIVYFWTTWCKGCKQAEKWYFEEPENKKYLSKNYHLVKVNGDSTKITLNEVEYGASKEQAHRHQLSLRFSKTWFGYPNILLFDKELNFINAYEPQIFMGYSSKNFITKLDSVRGILDQH